MYFTTAALVLTTLLSTTSALPYPGEDEDKDTNKAPEHTNEVQLCTEPNFQGQCYKFWTSDVVNLYGNTIGAEFLNDNTRSIRMSPRTTCRFSQDPNLMGTSFALRKGDELEDVDNKFFQKKLHWSTSISSFQCYAV
jgi:hypothetical protein